MSHFANEGYCLMSHFAERATGHPTCAVEDYEAVQTVERDLNPSIP